jgi:hypothetical protein
VKAKPSQAGQGSQSFWVRFESQELKPCSLLPPCILLMTALPEIAVVLIAMTCSSSMISLPSNVFFGVCRRCRDQNYGRIFTCVRACINLRATNPSMWYILCGSTVFSIIIISASTCVCVIVVNHNVSVRCSVIVVTVDGRWAGPLP